MPNLNATHDRERGSALVVVLILLTALAAASSVVVRMQLADTRSSGLTKKTRDTLYCAEAGLVAARPFIAVQQASWNDMLSDDPDRYPVGYPVTGDLDNPPDGVPDFVVTIKDNADEGAQANDPTEDRDLRVFMVSRCTKFADAPAELIELVRYENLDAGYRDMAGFSQTGSGNLN